MEDDLAEYERACHDYELNWKAIDTALYDLCKMYPNHQKRDGVNAKLWIIGRTYATGIERMILSKGSQGSSMTQLASHLWKHRQEADSAIELMRKVIEPLTPDKLKAIIAAHGSLLKLIHSTLRNDQAPRSFVSKYLHFHFPAVPIYDSVAAASLRRACPWKRRFEIYSLPAGADDVYGHFVMRFWQFYEELRSKAMEVNVKLVDHYLLALVQQDK